VQRCQPIKDFAGVTDSSYQAVVTLSDPKMLRGFQRGKAHIGLPGSWPPRRCLLNGCDACFTPVWPQARNCIHACRMTAARWRR
jgi:hypothetical protein